MRLVLELRSDVADKTAKHLCCVKGNYLPAEYKAESVKLRFTAHLTFKDSGERVPFECLVPKDANREAKYLRAIQLRDEGHTYEEIAQEIGYKEKSGVAKLIQRHENKSNTQNGQV